MSIAGTTSSQGDEFELQVALHWLITLYRDEEIDYVQVDSTGIPELEDEIPVDDIIVSYKDGRKKFIQAKKNQPRYQSWRFSDKVMKEELEKACKQHKKTPAAQIWFYSRSPFGNLQVLAEGVRKFGSYTSFRRTAPNTLKKPLKSLSRLTSVTLPKSFAMARQLFFDSSQDWASRNLLDLKGIFPKSNTVKRVLERAISEHAASLPGTPYVINRSEMLKELKAHDLEAAPIFAESEILDSFSAASKVGRNWQRTIDGVKIHQRELDEVVEAIDNVGKTILVSSQPGCGKTCLLLELVDQLEKDSTVGLLFIKGDQFANANSEEDLASMGLPTDIVGKCARLAEFRKVVVVVDSLDVLSLSRSHGAFKVVLNLIDRLSRIENLTVVAACREFDRQYDPQLRDREWQKTITITPFDFRAVVRPLLIEWDVNLEELGDNLKELICVPQHLSLFKVLVDSKNYLGLKTAWDLFDRYLVEYVEKDQLLGLGAIELLYQVANEMLKSRGCSVPSVTISSEPELCQRLTSQGILIEQQPGVLSFAHQTLAENLVVRRSIANGIGLVDFIQAHPPLPFIRPVVKAFFGHLRLADRPRFIREFRRALSSESVAYHLKRLLAESYAEMQVDSSDWGLIRWLLNAHPDLLRRCLYAARNISWLEMLDKRLLHAMEATADRESWERLSVQRLVVWVERYPEQVVSLWTRLYDSSSDRANTAYYISIHLGDLKKWDADGVGELLERLVGTDGFDRDFIGKPLSLWVAATDQGDELLWSYITKKVPEHGPARYDHDEKLRCNEHDFHNAEFLKKRFKSSKRLLDLALGSLIEWSQKEGRVSELHSFSDYFLMDSSWRYTHNKQDMYSADGINLLLSYIESALVWHAREDSNWWRQNEITLRGVQEIGFKYFLVLCYKENPSKNIEGIEALLTDPELLRYGRMRYEVGGLANSSYHLISADVADKHQEIILALYSEDGDDSDSMLWVERMRYESLVWIPSIYRAGKTQDHIDKYRRVFGYEHPAPQLYSSGGTVRRPFKAEKLCHLSADWIVKLARHYNEDVHFESLEEHLSGGKNEVLGAFRDAAALCPVHLLSTVSYIQNEGIDSQFISDVYSGLANHIRYLYGNLSSPHEKWEPKQRIPKEELLVAVVSGLDQQELLWTDLECVCGLLRAAADIVIEEDDVDQLLSFHEKLFSRLSKIDPAKKYTVEHGAEALLFLAEACVNKGFRQASKVDSLLWKYLLDGDESTLITFLQHLPYLIYKHPEPSWDYLIEALRKLPIDKWWTAERCFYHNYRGAFDVVHPYIVQLFECDSEECLEVAGRIYTLMFLTDLISESDYFSVISKAQDMAVKGAVGTFVHNLHISDISSRCSASLIRILNECNVTEAILQTFGNAFNDSPGRRASVTSEMVYSYLVALPKIVGHPGIFRFHRWLLSQAHNNPLLNLEYLEAMAESYEKCGSKTNLYGSREDIPVVLKEILVEADESDDPELIKRVIKLQDRLMKMDFDGISKLYDSYAA